MNDDQPTPRPDRLERAMDAMQSIDRMTLPSHVAARAAARRRAMPIRRVAAVAAAAAIVVGAATVALRSSATPAFADVVRRVEATRTVRAVLDVGEDGKLTVYASGTRTRVEQGATIIIHDVRTGEMLTLDPKGKVAVRTVMRGQATPSVVDFMRDMGTRATRPIEGRMIEGVATRGFEGTFDGKLVGQEGPQHVRVFVNPDTTLPVRIEQLTADVPSTVESAVSQIAFDVPLDDALFDLNPPAGYTLEEGGGIFAEALKPAATTREADALVLTPGVGLGAARFGMTLDQIKAALGEPDLVARGGFSVEYYSRGFGLLVDRRVGLAGITAYSRGYLTLANVHDFPGMTDRGIGMGATRAQIVAAYGEPASAKVEGGMETLRYDDSQLTFSLKDDKLAFLFLNRPPRK